MRIIFSRKGFDSGSGGAPSPVIDGKPISLPIPTERRSLTTYDDLGFGGIVESVTRGKIKRGHLCHEDPMFHGHQCVFGQCGSSQAHLHYQGVGAGDLFLFFGLFVDEVTRERHHRIFGFLRVENIVALGPISGPRSDLAMLPRVHPHTIGEWNANNTIYRGPGRTATRADAALRLTQLGGPLRNWIVPTWLRNLGLSYHGSGESWIAPDRLQIVARGQEFVADVGEDVNARNWSDEIVKIISA